MGLKQFAFTGRRKDGNTVKGEVTAWDREQALRDLLYDGVTVTSLTEKEGEKLVGDPLVRLSGERLAILYRQVSTMYRAGIALDRAFRLLSKGAEEETEPTPQVVEGSRGLNVRVRPRPRKKAAPNAEARICLGVAEALTRGLTLSQAMSLYPNVFGPPHIAMCNVGASGGIMPEILDELARLTERADALQKKVRSSTTYPIFVLVASLLTVFALFNFIMPQFMDLVKEMNVKLPFFTWMLIYAAQVMRHPITLALMVGLVILWPRIWKNLKQRRQVKHLLDTGSTRAFIFGQVTMKVSLARAMQILAALTSAGINLRDSLPMAGKACGNQVLGDALEVVGAQLVHGVTMSQAMRLHKDVFPRALVAYVETGELSGQLPEMLVRAADIMSLDADAALDVLPELLEPLIIFFLGAVVGGIVLSVFMPLYGALKTL